MLRFSILSTITTILLAVHPSASARAQVDGCGLAFDGADDQVNVYSSTVLPTTTYTLSAWVATTGPNTHAIMSRGEDDTSDVLPWGFGIRGGGIPYLQIEHGSASGTVYDATANVGDGELHHVAVTRAADGTVAFYVDGVAAGTYFGSLDPAGSSNHGIQIGYSLQTNNTGPPDPNLFFIGLLDEMTLWELALDSSEVAELYASGLPGSTVGLLGYWRFSEGNGQLSADESPEGSMNATIGESGAIEDSDPAWDCVVSSVSDAHSSASQLQLLSPNPSGERTRVALRLERASAVHLRVLDAAGRQWAALQGAPLPAGRHEFSWNGENTDGRRAPSGVYFLQLITDETREVSRLVLVR